MPWVQEGDHSWHPTWSWSTEGWRESATQSHTTTSRLMWKDEVPRDRDLVSQPWGGCQHTWGTWCPGATYSCLIIGGSWLRDLGEQHSSDCPTNVTAGVLVWDDAHLVSAIVTFYPSFAPLTRFFGCRDIETQSLGQRRACGDPDVRIKDWRHRDP